MGEGILRNGSAPAGAYVAALGFALRWLWLYVGLLLGEAHGEGAAAANFVLDIDRAVEVPELSSGQFW
jgi:hypothetical protein